MEEINLKTKNVAAEIKIVENFKLLEKLLYIGRVTKVTKGMKKLSYQAFILVGDKKSRVGLGIGKADDVQIAIQKAINNGSKNLIQFKQNKNKSIPFEISTKFCASKILLKPGKLGMGIKASAPIRSVLEFVGLENISVKQLGSHHLINNVKATLLALTHINEQMNLVKTNYYS